MHELGLLSLSHIQCADTNCLVTVAAAAEIVAAAKAIQEQMFGLHTCSPLHTQLAAHTHS